MKIIIYTVSDCQFSKQEKDYLITNNLPYEEKNLEQNREWLTEMLAVSNNFAGTPVTKIEKDDGSIVVLKGFTKEEFDKELGIGQPTVAQVNAQIDLPQSPTSPQSPTYSQTQPDQSSSPPSQSQSSTQPPTPANPSFSSISSSPAPTALPTQPVNETPATSQSSPPTPSNQTSTPSSQSPSAPALQNQSNDQLNSIIKDLQNKSQESSLTEPTQSESSPSTNLPNIPDFGDK